MDEAVREIVMRGFEQASTILKHHQKMLERCANALLEHETLDAKALAELTAGLAVHQAQAARDANSEESIAPVSALHETEQLLGVADWIDPETGEPAEGGSPPHLPDE